jgi:hypothetical protein
MTLYGFAGKPHWWGMEQVKTTLEDCWLNHSHHHRQHILIINSEKNTNPTNNFTQGKKRCHRYKDLCSFVITKSLLAFGGHSLGPESSNRIAKVKSL